MSNEENELAKVILSHKKLKGNAFAQSLLLQLQERGKLSESQMKYVIGKVNPRGYPTFQAQVGDVKVASATKEVASFVPTSSLFQTTSINRTRTPTPETTVGAWEDTSKFDLIKFPYKTFNPVQSLILDHYDKDTNLVVAAATSVGKTCIAEMLLAYTIQVQQKKGIFLSPLKAVTKEKYDSWTDPTHPFSKYNISIVTGDYVLTDARVDELKAADIILLTSEMLDSRTRNIALEKNSWLLDTGTLVCDEAHLLTVEERGDNLETGLMRFTNLVKDCRVVLLSATMPNVDEIADWISKLNSRSTVCINSSWRPCVLDVHFEPFNDRGDYFQVEESKRSKAIQLVTSHPTDKFLVFVHSKKLGESICRALQGYGEKVEFHSADLPLHRRVDIEKSFRSKDGIRILVCTSTLAWGVNLPARRVVICGVTRGWTPVSTIDLRQMAGRAGRVGLDPKGDVYLLVPHSESMIVESRFNKPEEIVSRLKDRSDLAFHLVSEINQELISDEKSLADWYNRSLAAFQGIPLDSKEAELVLRDLLTIGAVKLEGSKYKITKLGKVSSDLYLSPFDVSAWARNFSAILRSKHSEDDVAIAWALTDIPMFNDKFQTSIDIKDDLESATRRLIRLGITGKYNVAGLYLQGKLSGKIPPNLRNVTVDVDRGVAACSQLDKEMKWFVNPYFNALKIRLENGVSFRYANLMVLDGVGKVYAEKLLADGIKYPKELRNNPDKGKRILGASRYEKIIRDNGLLF